MNSPALARCWARTATFSFLRQAAVANACQKRSINYLPEYRWHRSRNVYPIPLPDFSEKAPESMEELRIDLKKKGIQPVAAWQEKPTTIASTTAILEPYVPPEGDGKVTMVSAKGARDAATLLGKKSLSYMAVRKIRSYEEGFDTGAFADLAQQIYLTIHETLTEFPLEKEKLRGLVTELHYPEVMHFMDKKTVRWKFLKSLEPPRVVHARQSHFITKTNVFAQVTVRLHTQQVLAVYDRFGRLEFGSETTAKDVLEYCVFERHLSALYGEWRLHGKIVPSWAKPKESLPRTFVIPQHARSGLPKPESLRPSGHPSYEDKYGDRPPLATA